MTLRFRPYSASKPAALKPGYCVGCGRPVDHLKHPEIGIPIQLERTPPPVGLELTDAAHAGRVWEWRGEWIGWCNKFTPQRSWREIRLAHRCESSARTRRSA